MMRIFSSQRFLAIYSGVLTTVFLFTVLSGFARQQTKQSASQDFDVITVHRINVVEPDGTLRLIISNKTSAPGVYIKNKEYPHPNRQTAGLIFLDEEGTEDGGLAYGIEKDAAGHVRGSNGHLSFDQYMQDQIFTIDAGREGTNKYSLMTIDDRGDYNIMDALELSNRIAKLPEDKRTKEIEAFRARHPGDHKRVVLGRLPDGSSTLRLKDAEGRDRIVLLVAADGSPKLQLLDAQGKTVSELPSK
jgi:hypothetical protein